MPVVFLHGNPDTHRVWSPLLPYLRDEEVVALDLPGFGCPRPEGFHATRWEYRDWLLEQLERFDAPVHLVGHDVGGIIVQGAVIAGSERIASWTIASGVADPDYGWHRQGRVWQTAGLGETWRDGWLTMSDEDRINGMVSIGMPREGAEVAVKRYDRTLCDAALDLYRSLPYMGDWSFSAEQRYAPGLVLWGESDPFQPQEFGARQAELARASFFSLSAGHWWQYEQPKAAAELLRAHWQSVRLDGAVTAPADQAA